MIDRDRIIRWWTGKLTDVEMSEASGMNLDTLRWLLKQPIVQLGVRGGGRGRRTTRRIHPRIRNAIAIAEAANRAGLPMELAVRLATQIPNRFSDVVDWLPGKTEAVVYDSERLPLCLFDVPPELQNPSSNEALEKARVRECDPLDFWSTASSEVTASPFDAHLVIYDGHVVAQYGPLSDAESALRLLWQGRIDLVEDLGFGPNPAEWVVPVDDESPVGRLDQKEVVLWGYSQGFVRIMSADGVEVELPGVRGEILSEADKRMFERVRKNFTTRTDINLTLPVRLMKRKFYKLTVEK